MEPNFPRAARRKSSIGPKTILRIIAKYALFGGVWVTCSDLLVYRHGGETGQDAAIGLLKGLLFVAVSAVLLYAIISKSVHGTVAERDALRERLKSWNLDANDMVWLLDGNGRVLEVNDRAVDAHGFTESEFCEKAFVDLLADKNQFAESWDRLLEDGTLRTEAMHCRADGTAFPVELSARRFDIDGTIYIHGIGRDMTERRYSERELVKLKDAYAALSQTNQCMNTCSDRSDLFQRTCEIAVSCMHIQLAWVGIIDDEQRSIAMVAKAGPASSYTEHLSVSIDPNRDTSRGPAGRAVLTGVPVVVNDLWDSDGFQPWTQKLIEYGFKSWAAFPLTCDGHVVGVLTLYSDDRQFFTDQIAALFREMTQNLSMTLERLTARAMQEALEGELKKLRTAVEQSPVTVLISDADGSIQYVNPAFTHSSGYSADEVLGKNPRILKSDEMSTEEYASMWNQLTQGNTWMGHFHNRRKDGSLYWEEAVISPVKDANGNITHFISVKQDVTARREAEAKANFLAFHDPLTELPNRLVAKRDMTEAMLEADLTGNKAALLFIDVDNFKKVNDSLGHAVGDRLLQALVERIRSCMREDDSLSRISGDEFLIVARGIHGADVVSSVAKRIHASLVSPLSIDEMQIVTTVSIGIAVYPDDGKSFDELHRHADLAMYSAKKDGRNTFRIYSGSMESDVRQYMLTVAALRRALDRSEFVIHYQPQLHLETRAVRAVEALLRWNHPELGLVPPTEFISIAEDCGLIIEIGHWVVREACRQAAIWRAAGLPDLTIAINISPLQLRRDDFKYMITAALDATGIAPGVLELELTESALIQDFTNTSALLSSLKDLGIHTALDDFGTGYSNFISLRHLNLDTLKIDQSFIRNMTSNRRDVAIVRSIVQLARNLGLATVAEGVETDQCLEVARRAGCDHGQGFLLARPMSSEAVRDFILGRSPSKGDEKVAEDSYPE